MRNEIRELLEKAKKGDYNAGQMMVNNGIDCHRNGDIDGAIEWWEAAASADMGDALWNLTYIIYGNPSVGKHDEKQFMYWLGELAYEWKNPQSMVVLGAILCGDSRNHYINNVYPGLKSAYNPKEGFALIEDAVRRAGNTAKYSQNPLGYLQYSSYITDAYQSDTYKRNTDYKTMFFQDIDHAAALAKQLIYQESAIAALKANRGTNHVNDFEETLAVEETILNNCKKELLAVLGMWLGKEAALDSMSALLGEKRAVIGKDILKYIHNLRKDGLVGGIPMADKDELADVLEVFLHTALKNL